MSIVPVYSWTYTYKCVEICNSDERIATQGTTL